MVLNERRKRRSSSGVYRGCSDVLDGNGRGSREKAPFGHELKISSVVAILGLGGHRYGIAAHAHGGWQSKGLAEKGERARSQMLDPKNLLVRRFPYFSDRRQACRNERLSHPERKFDVQDRRVIRKFGRWIDHDRFRSTC